MTTFELVQVALSCGHLGQTAVSTERRFDRHYCSVHKAWFDVLDNRVYDPHWQLGDTWDVELASETSTKLAEGTL